jgi:aryl-alcohol dehydrogenase-like predicted oxidoreductase
MKVSALSLGSWHIWDRMEFGDAVTLIRTAFEAGITLFDVGHYNFGPHVEGSDTDLLFGRIVRAAGIARSEYLLSEKLWLWDYPRRSLADQLDESLERVGATHADLVVLGDFSGPVDLRRVVAEVGELIAAGRVRQWGVNNWAADDLRFVHDFAVSESLETPVLAQLKYSLCRRSIADGEPYRRLFAETGIGLQASDVFEGGILAGGTPGRRIGADTGGIREAITAAAPRVAEIAAEFGATPAQLAIGFCLTHPSVVSVLFGASRLDQLVDDLGAIQLVREHGEAIRERVGDLWLDRGVVAPDASWGTASFGP